MALQQRLQLGGEDQAEVARRDDVLQGRKEDAEQGLKVGDVTLLGVDQLANNKVAPIWGEGGREE